MNLESISQPIKTESVEEHEQLLNEKLEALKLEYVDKLYLHKVEPLEDFQQEHIVEDHGSDACNDFRFLLNRYTSVLRDLMDSYIARWQKEKQWDNNMYAYIEADYKEKILQLYTDDHEHWVEKTLDFVKQEKAKSPKKLYPPQSQDDEREQAGLIHFDVDSGYDKLFHIDVPGVSSKDRGITIHLDPVYKNSTGDTDTNIFSSHSLEILATQIVKKYPETKAIFAQSWLVQTPIAKRIGFEIYPAVNKITNNNSFWGQFMDDKGQINKKRVDQFLETGKPPYEIGVGVIQTEDFLKKYLPKELRGKVILKELNPNFQGDNREHDIDLFQKAIDGWDSLNETGLKDIISQAPFIQKFNTTEEGKGFLDYLIKAKQMNKSKAEVQTEAHTDPVLKLYSPAFQKFKNIEDPNKFINKEVTIE